MADFPARQWSCDECRSSPRTHAQRGRCGGGFTAATPDARLDSAGRWWLPFSETCKGTGGSAALADLRLYRCPVALAQRVWASPAPALYGSTQQGGSMATHGVGELSEGGAAAVRVLDVAWAWRRDIEAEMARQRRDNAKGCPRG